MKTSNTKKHKNSEYNGEHGRSRKKQKKSSKSNEQPITEPGDDSEARFRKTWTSVLGLLYSADSTRRTYVDRKDISNLRTVCKGLADAAGPVLFRHALVKDNLESYLKLHKLSKSRFNKDVHSLTFQFEDFSHIYRANERCVYRDNPDTGKREVESEMLQVYDECLESKSEWVKENIGGAFLTTVFYGLRNLESIDFSQIFTEKSGINSGDSKRDRLLEGVISETILGVIAESLCAASKRAEAEQSTREERWREIIRSALSSGREAPRFAKEPPVTSAQIKTLTLSAPQGGGRHWPMIGLLTQLDSSKTALYREAFAHLRALRVCVPRDTDDILQGLSAFLCSLPMLEELLLIGAQPTPPEVFFERERPELFISKRNNRPKYCLLSNIHLPKLRSIQILNSSFHDTDHLTKLLTRHFDTLLRVQLHGTFPSRIFGKDSWRQSLAPMMEKLKLKTREHSQKVFPYTYSQELGSYIHSQEICFYTLNNPKDEYWLPPLRSKHCEFCNPRRNRTVF